jgi:hypothetical protein
LPEATTRTENLLVLQESLRRCENIEAAINFSIAAILVTSFAVIFALFLSTIAD